MLADSGTASTDGRLDGNGEALVAVAGLTKRFPVTKNLFRQPSSFIHAVDDVSFRLASRREPGVGGRVGLWQDDGGQAAGEAAGTDVRPNTLPLPVVGCGRRIWRGGGRQRDPLRADLRAFRRQAQMIFQDPYESMNPRRTIYDTIAEPLAVQGIGSLMDRVDRVTEILTQAGLTPASSFLFRHPHELSGGQRQRVAIARALVIGPSFVVADEPTSMLDVSSRTGIMLLMQELAASLGIAYLYITHDLAVARYMCHRIAVMYLGKIVELAETEELLRNPLHPYTKALLSAVPVPDPAFRRDRPDIRGDLTLPIDPPARCRFYDRCPVATDFCEGNVHPPMEERAASHWVACYEA